MENETLDFLRKQLDLHQQIRISSLKKIEANQRENEELEKLVATTESEILRLEGAVGAYKNLNHNPVPVLNSNSLTYKESNKKERSKKINWGALSITVLKKHNRLMTTTEILESIFPYLSYEEKTELSPKLSSSLYKLSKKQKIQSFDKGVKGYYYGLPPWFEESSLPFIENITPKQEYLI